MALHIPEPDLGRERAAALVQPVEVLLVVVPELE